MEVFTENTSAVEYINNKGGCRSPLMCELALTIWRFCVAENILLKATHVTGEQNFAADKFSRLEFDPHDFALKQEIFRN